MLIFIMKMLIVSLVLLSPIITLVLFGVKALMVYMLFVLAISLVLFFLSIVLIVVIEDKGNFHP